eukprot:m.23118 g.23118  ORF g.23118 m.23118 type:complete len:62 (+) comp12908_c0_seq2:1825-2010(+)
MGGSSYVGKMCKERRVHCRETKYIPAASAMLVLLEFSNAEENVACATTLDSLPVLDFTCRG